MIDCHCHLADKEFLDDLDKVVENAITAGVKAIIVVPETVIDFERVLSIKQRHPLVIAACLGVHPIQPLPDGDKRRIRLEDVAEALPLMEKFKDEIVGVGEVGLDFTPYQGANASEFDSKIKENHATQRTCLEQQVKFAASNGLPLNLHSRSAGKHVIDALTKSLNIDSCMVGKSSTLVHMHAFDGSLKDACAAAERGFYFSLPPSSIRSDQKMKLVRGLPLDRLLLETDSPVLGPQKDSRNEPANVRLVAELIARERGIAVDEVIRITTQNALTVYPKLARLFDSAL